MPCYSAVLHALRDKSFASDASIVEPELVLQIDAFFRNTSNNAGSGAYTVGQKFMPTGQLQIVNCCPRLTKRVY